MDPKQLKVILQEELTPIKEELASVKEDVASIKEAFREELAPIIKTQQAHSRKLNDITVELHHVHELAKITLDVVKGRYEKNKAEIDEIKDHLGLPKKPYFGDQP